MMPLGAVTPRETLLLLALCSMTSTTPLKRVTHPVLGTFDAECRA